MRRRKTPALAPLIAAAVVSMLAWGTPAAAQNDRAGDFDHYILALSWMPAFCTLEGDRRNDERCAPGTRNGWMVHGLWPQHAGGGWPEYCNTPHRAPTRRETAEEVDIFGASGAAWHQWNKHGRCTGLSAAQYYELTRAALARLELPPIFERIEQSLSLSPQVIEDAFIEANAEARPGLTAETMVTSCRSNALTELRICLTRDLEPRACDRAVRSCPARQTNLLPLR